MSGTPIGSTDSSDAIAVRGLVHRYADAVVHRDEAQWKSTWADDAVWDIAGQRLEGPEAIVAFWNGAMDRFAAVVQTVLNGEAAFDAEAGTGTGRWYIQEHFQRIDGEVGMMLGYYDDTYVRTDEGWRFTGRELSVTYGGNPKLEGTFHKAWAEVAC
ncbi:MAG: nuclear transport factor 2 family protein [Actinomycetota bacterium]